MKYGNDKIIKLKKEKRMKTSPLEELLIYDLSLPKTPQIEKTPMWKMVLYYIAGKAKWKSKDRLQLIKLFDFVIQEIEKEKVTDKIKSESVL